MSEPDYIPYLMKLVTVLDLDLREKVVLVIKKNDDGAIDVRTTRWRNNMIYHDKTVFEIDAESVDKILFKISKKYSEMMRKNK